MGRSYQKYQLNVVVEVKWLKHQRARLFSECRGILNTLGKANLSGVRILGYSLIYKMHRKIKAFIGALNFVRAGPATEHNVVYIIPCVIACRVGIWFLRCPSLGYIKSYSFFRWGIWHFIDKGRVWAMRGLKHTDYKLCLWTSFLYKRTKAIQTCIPVFWEMKMWIDCTQNTLIRENCVVSLLRKIHKRCSGGKWLLKY